MITPHRTCARAAQIIRERGWCQRQMRDEDGRVCCAGALIDAVHELHGDEPFPWVNFTAAKSLVLSRAGIEEMDLAGLAYTVALTKWNDSSKTTEEEVLRCLEGR